MKGGGGLLKGVFWPPTKCFYFLQVNSLTCVLYPGIPLLAHDSGCFRARTPLKWVGLFSLLTKGNL